MNVEDAWKMTADTRRLLKITRRPLYDSITQIVGRLRPNFVTTTHCREV